MRMALVVVDREKGGRGASRYPDVPDSGGRDLYYNETSFPCWESYLLASGRAKPMQPLAALS